MKSNRIMIIMGGALVIFLISGGWFFAQNRMHVELSPSVRAESATEMQAMEGMPMEHGSGQPVSDQTAVTMTPARRQLIGVKTGLVEERVLDSSIRAVGAVAYDERRIRQVNLRVSGWITHLLVDYTGQSVQKGDLLFTLYSPELIATQEEYLLARRMAERVKASPVAHVSSGAAAQIESAGNRLLLWGLTEAQIEELEQGEQPRLNTTIYSPITGVVTKKTALEGMYVTPEMSLYELADLSIVWLTADIYEYEISRVKIGQEATVTLVAYPGEAFHGRVVYIDPYLNVETRTVKVRMEFPNAKGLLKPGMYGHADIKTTAGKQLAIPQEAVLDSGTRTLVFVNKEEGVYEPRAVQLGHQVDGFYPVLAGLNAGERVVTSATFLIDSESKLMAATSMMGMLGMGGIKMEQAQMGEMEMGGMKDMEGMEGMKMDRPSSSREQTVEGLTVTLVTEPEPPKKGNNRLRLTVRFQGAPVTDARVTLGYTMAMPGMEMETVEAKHTKNGMYEAEADFGMRGPWEVEVAVVRGQSAPVKAKFTVSVGK